MGRRAGTEAVGPNSTNGEISMLRTFGVAGIALVAIAFGSTAQAANDPLIVWQGSATITSLSHACNTIGFGIGDLVTSTYRPRLVGDEPTSGITFITGRSALVFFNGAGNANDQMIGRGGYLGHYIGSRATAVPNSTQGSFTGNYVFRVKPAAITSATGAITINGTLTNFFNVTNCTVGFLGAYQPRGD
jgi:hypothetical protein